MKHSPCSTQLEKVCLQQRRLSIANFFFFYLIFLKELSRESDDRNDYCPFEVEWPNNIEKCPQAIPSNTFPSRHPYFLQETKGSSLRDSLIAVIAREAVISSTTQGLPTPSQVQLRLFLATREGRLSNLEMAWKSVISKPRIKLNTFGICILFGFGEEDEFEGAADAVILFP